MGQRGAIYVWGTPRASFFGPHSPDPLRFVPEPQQSTEKLKKFRSLTVQSVDRQDVLEAQQRIAGLVERTPLIESEVGGVSVTFKCECLQTGGAFKLRGATNRLLQLSPEERDRGVVAFSSGNHARGVAIAAKRLGVRAVIVMP